MNFKTHKTYTIGVLSILILALLIRVLWVTSYPTVQSSDFLEYHKLAVSLATKGYYGIDHPDCYRPPGYSFFLAVFYRLIAPDAAVAIGLNIILETLSCFLVFKLSELLFKRKTAIIALILFSLNPISISSCSLLASEHLFIPILLLLLISSIKYLRTYKVAYLIQSGLLWAIGSLVRPTIFLYPVVLVILLILLNRRKEVLKSLVVYLTIFLIIILPWTIRNYHHFKRIIVFSANTGINLYIGNNPYSFRYEARKIQFPEEAKGLSYEKADRIYLKYAIANIKSRPLWYFIRGFFKVAQLFDGIPFPLHWINRGVDNKYRFDYYYPLFMWYFYILMLLSFVSFFTIRKPGKEQMLIYLFILYWIMMHFIFYGKSRFHFPLEPIMSVYAGYSLYCRFWSEVSVKSLQ